MILSTENAYYTKNSCLELGRTASMQYVRKTARSSDGANDIVSQAKMIRSLPLDIARHYPAILTSDLDCERPWYEMPYYELPTFREAMWSSSLDAVCLGRKLSTVVRFLAERLYRWKRDVPSGDYIKQIYSNRLIRRLSGLVSDFDYVVSAKRIIWENNIIQPPLEIIDRIGASKTLGDLLVPPFVCSIHGQLEFDHILVQPNFSDDDFILLDPRGGADLIDPAYDIGKLLISAKSAMDLVKENKFRLSYQKEGDSIVISDFVIFEEDRKEVRLNVLQSLYRDFSDLSRNFGDDHILIRSEFAEAVHLCSSVPFYISHADNGHQGLAFYIMGALLLQRFLDCYK